MGNREYEVKLYGRYVERIQQINGLCYIRRAFTKKNGEDAWQCHTPIPTVLNVWLMACFRSHVIVYTVMYAASWALSHDAITFISM